MIASVEDPNLWECIECGRMFYVDSKNDGTPIPFHLNKVKRDKPFSNQGSVGSVREESSLLEQLPDWDRSIELQHEVSSPHFRCSPGKVKKKRRTKQTPSLFWLTLLIGVVTFTCGGSTIAWSLLSGSNSVWQVGIPIAFAGQAILFVTFVLQLDWLTERTADNAQLIQRFGRNSASDSKRSRTLKTQFIRGTELNA